MSILNQSFQDRNPPSHSGGGKEKKYKPTRAALQYESEFTASGFHYYKGDACPVCHGAEKSCRVGQTAIFCASGNEVDGLFNKGPDAKQSHFYRYILQTELDGEATPEERQEWAKAKAAKSAAANAAKLTEIAKLTPIADRHSIYLATAARNGLSDKHREDLEKRGLSAEQIAELNVFSVGGADPGYVVGIPGLDGKIIGGQKRCDIDLDGKGRYRWAFTAGSSALPVGGINTEMPVAVYSAAEPTCVALVEGTGVKPYLASKVLGAIALGAAGGNHLSSMSQVGPIIAANPDLSLLVIPDAGDVLNNAVMRRHEATANAFPQALFLYWGQETKEACDIDEQPDLSNALYLDWAEFKALSGDLLGAPSILALPAAAPTPTPTPTPINRPSARPVLQRAPWAAGMEKYLADCQALAPKFDAQENADREEKAAQKLAMVADNWHAIEKNSSLIGAEQLPNVSVTEYVDQKCEFDLGIKPGATIFLSGRTGSGKTFRSTAALTRVLKDEDSGIDKAIIVVPLVSLGQGFIERLEGTPGWDKSITVMTYMEDARTARALMNAPGQRVVVVMCLEGFKSYSIGQMSRNLDSTVMFIDEGHSVRDGFTSLVHESKLFFAAMSQCAAVVVADAHLGLMDIKTVQAQGGRTGTVQVFRQQAATAKFDTEVIFREVVTGKGYVSQSRKRGAYLETMSEALARRDETGLPVAMMSDSRMALKTMDAWTRENRPDLNVLLTTGLTIEDNQEFLRNPEEYIAAHNIDVVLSSPVMRSGVDIGKTRFSTVIGAFPGNGSPEDCLQHVRRVRHADRVVMLVEACNYGESFGGSSLKYSHRKASLRSTIDGLKALGQLPSLEWQFLGQWQRLIKGFGAQNRPQILLKMMQDQYKSVVCDLREADTETWDALTAIQKVLLTEKVWTGDRTVGKQMDDDKRGPKTDAEAFDAILFNHVGKDEELGAMADMLKAQIPLGEGKTEAARHAFTLAQILTTEKTMTKLERLAVHHSQFSDRMIESDLEYVLRNKEITEDSREKQNIIMAIAYRDLNLKALAVMLPSDISPVVYEMKTGSMVPAPAHSGYAAKVRDESVFSAESPAVVERYEAFLAHPALSNLQPEAAGSIHSFWPFARKCMQAHGHKQVKAGLREAGDTLRPNGSFGGKQRATKSVVVEHFGFTSPDLFGDANAQAMHPEMLALAIRRVESRFARREADRIDRESQGNAAARALEEYRAEELEAAKVARAQTAANAASRPTAERFLAAAEEEETHLPEQEPLRWEDYQTAG
jgi:energy-coupling factor transporter ATP-binding protein EcfA2